MKETFKSVFSKIEKLVLENPKDLHLQTCQILKAEIYHYDWVGFYILKGSTLELEVFAGKPTDHTAIAVGKGVCGQVAEKKETIIVQDVSKEENYISCSIDVQSEIVVPVIKAGEFVAELDIDSHSPAPFSKDDQVFLEKICALMAPSF
jgi:GAF domain-containing protein